MKGAIAVPAVKTIIKAKSSKIIISGNSQNFFLTLKNCQSSFKNSILSDLKFKVRNRLVKLKVTLRPAQDDLFPNLSVVMRFNFYFDHKFSTV
jgi:hypothetical protein